MNEYPAFTLRELNGEALEVESDTNPLSYLIACGHMEVIGNVYENPNLITKS